MTFELEQAALGGDEDAMLRMGKLYEDGNEDIKQNYEEAIRWYELSVESCMKCYYLGQERVLSEAHLRAGLLMLELDKTDGKYWHKAIGHLKEAGNAGVVEAMYIVGTELVKYSVNQGVANYQESCYDDLRRTFADGIDWLNRAANNNLIDALVDLADMYANGEINDGRNPEWGEADEYEDLEEAIKLYEKAYAIESNDNYQEAINRIEEKLEALSNGADEE